jgi:hypothetical protein
VWGNLEPRGLGASGRVWWRGSGFPHALDLDFCSGQASGGSRWMFAPYSARTCGRAAGRPVWVRCAAGVCLLGIGRGLGVAWCRRRAGRVREVRGVINTRGRRGPLDAGSGAAAPASVVTVLSSGGAAGTATKDRSARRAPLRVTAGPGRGGGRSVRPGRRWVGGRAIPLVAAASVPAGAAGDECGGARPGRGPSCRCLPFPDRCDRSR